MFETVSWTIFVYWLQRLSEFKKMLGHEILSLSNIWSRPCHGGGRSAGVADLDLDDCHWKFVTRSPRPLPVATTARGSFGSRRQVATAPIERGIRSTAMTMTARRWRAQVTE